MADKNKKPNPFLEKKEEKLHKDLDHDGEKGESAAHRAKVLGKAAASKPAKGAVRAKASAAKMHAMRKDAESKAEKQQDRRRGKAK